MTKKIYSQPEMQIAQMASMTLMQAVSSAGDTLGMKNIESDQW